MPGNNFHIVRCDNWEHFTEHLRSATQSHIPLIFRGQANGNDDKWLLSSIWERCRENTKATSVYLDGPSPVPLLDVPKQVFLEPFKEMTIGLPGFSHLSMNDDLGWWGLARHYGLITPLLDWSKSPYIAAFFACFDRADKAHSGFKSGTFLWEWFTKEQPEPIRLGTNPISIWSLEWKKDLENEEEFKIFSPQFDFTPYTARMRGQQSVFTFLNHMEFTDLKDYLCHRQVGDRLTEYQILPKEIFKSLKDMKRMNISYSSLFPDLHGASTEINTLRNIQVLSRFLESNSWEDSF